MCIAALAPLAAAGGAAGGAGSIASVIGTVATIAGTVTGMQAQRQAAQAETASAEYQAKQARIMAEDTLKRGAADEQAKRRQTAALEGRQRAVMAASNLDLSSGSPLAVLTDTAILGELDADTVKNNAQREATQQRAQAGIYDMKAKAADQAGKIGVISTALGGVSTLADKWYRNRQPSGGLAR